MPNDAKTKLDRDTHRLQDQPKITDPVHPARRDEADATARPADHSTNSDQRQPLQSQQRDVTGTTLPGGDDYGPKTDAASDHPYADDSARPGRPPARPHGKDGSTPPDSHTDINSEADLGDPSGR